MLASVIGRISGNKMIIRVGFGVEANAKKVVCIRSIGRQFCFNDI